MRICEKRKVAKNLRAAAEEFADGSPWLVEDLMQAVGFKSYEEGNKSLFIRLAELIDCHVCETGSCDYIPKEFE